MKKSLRIFLACFLGIICGGLVLSKITGQFSFLRLIIGMIVGGPLGYLGYDFKAVIKAIPKAWRAVSDWWPDKEYRATLGILFWGFLNVIWSACVLVTGLLILTGEPITLFALRLLFVIIGPSLAFFLFFVFFCEEPEMNKRIAKSIKSNLKYINPFSFYLWYAPKYIFLGIIWLIKGVVYILPRIPGIFWKVIVLLALFVKTLIIMIHRDERLVCMFDVMLGIVIFYFWGNLILSAIIGGLLAVLNWQIISVRILHLAPSKTNNA